MSMEPNMLHVHLRLPGRGVLLVTLLAGNGAHHLFRAFITNRQTSTAVHAQELQVQDTEGAQDAHSPQHRCSLRQLLLYPVRQLLILEKVINMTGLTTCLEAMVEP